MDTCTVGNDVVDLGDPRIEGKTGDTRFLERVLAPAEREALAAAADPDRLLWTCWAAKEATYKVVSKRLSAPPVFIHREYVLREHVVEHAGVSYPLRVDGTARWIHVVAADGAAPEHAFCEVHPLDRASAPWSAPLEELCARMTAREVDAVHSLRSAAVRLGARAALARALGVEERRLEIVCDPGPAGRRPPRVLLDGRPGPADVSLSHHGGWIAWAVLLHDGRG